MPDFLSSSLMSKDGLRLNVAAYVLLLVLSFAFFLPGLTTIPPVDRDEPLFAQATKQMIETGNYVDIRFQNHERYKKPIGIYWLQAASVRLLNPDHLNEIWAYRIPSLLGAVISVLLTAALGTMLFGANTGLFAGLMLMSCIVLNAEARLAKTDAALLATIVAAQYFLAVAYRRQIKNWLQPFTFWLALGVGFLIKGPVVLLPLVSTLIWLRRKDGNLKWFADLRPAWGIPFAATLVLPWLIAIMLASHGAFLAQSAGQDMLGKLWKSQDKGAILPPGLYLLAFPLSFFPFSILALLAIPQIWKQRHDHDVAFCLGWIIPAWITVELFLTKLPHYVLPVYPAIAILSAKASVDGLKFIGAVRHRWFRQLAFGYWIVAAFAFAAVSIGIPFLIDHKFNPYALFGAVTLLVCTGIASVWLAQQATQSAIIFILAGFLIFVDVTFGCVFPNIENFWLSRDIVRMADKIKTCDHRVIVSAPYAEPSLIFLGGTDTITHLVGMHVGAELDHNPCAIAALDDDRLPSFLSTGTTESLVQPKYMGTIHSYSIGNGFARNVSFYVMPPHQKPKAKP